MRYDRRFTRLGVTDAEHFRIAFSLGCLCCMDGQAHHLFRGRRFLCYWQQGAMVSCGVGLIVVMIVTI